VRFFSAFAILQAGRRERLLVTGLIVPLVLLLHDPAQHDGYIVWTPYQQIQYSRHYAGNGDFAAGFLRVNHTGYQSIVNLSSWFLARHPNLLLGPADENPTICLFVLPCLSSCIGGRLGYWKRRSWGVAQW